MVFSFYIIFRYKIYDFNLIRRLRRIKEKIIGPMPKTQSEFEPGRSDEMRDGSKLQWVDKTFNNDKGRRKELWCRYIYEFYYLYT